MLKIILILALIPFSFAHAEDCKNSLKTFRDKKADPDRRSLAAQCLIANQLDRSEVALSVLRTIKDNNEDLFLREDLIEFFSKANLRKKIKVEGHLGPEVTEQEKTAIGSVAGGNTNDLLAMANAVKSMEEITPVTKYESEFFKALSEIAMNDNSHVLLRAAAVHAMEKTSGAVVASGIYDEKSIRLAKETIRTMAMREDIYSYYSGATLAYRNVSSLNTDGRRLSSQTSPVPAR